MMSVLKHKLVRILAADIKAHARSVAVRGVIPRQDLEHAAIYLLEYADALERSEGELVSSLEALAQPFPGPPETEIRVPRTIRMSAPEGYFLRVNGLDHSSDEKPLVRKGDVVMAVKIPDDPLQPGPDAGPDERSVKSHLRLERDLNKKSS
jgi:hypothetical protein